MKKFLAGLVALAMLMSFAFAESEDLLGTWYCTLFGMQITLEVNEDGTYEMLIPDEDPATGGWAYCDEGLVMDPDTEESVVLVSTDGMLVASDDEMELVFAREPGEIFEPAAARTDAALEEYAGIWKTTLIAALGMQGTPEDFGVDLTLSIDGTTVELTMIGMGDDSPVTIEGTFENGVLTIVRAAESEYLDDTTFVVQLLEDGMLDACIDFLGSPMDFYMEAAE